MVSQAHGNATNTQRDNMAEQVNFKDLLGTGAHFGHVTSKWHPNYEPYILMERNGVHIINLDETVKHLNTAIDFVKKVVEKNGEILFVGTKKQAKDIVQQEADRCGMFYIVERWLGGTLTNFSTIKKSIKRLKELEKEGSSIYDNLTKKEIQKLNRERLKLSDQHRGIKDMRRLPDLIVIVDVEREITALEEAIRLEIPVVAVVDSNCDPRVVDYPIPANDDSIRTIQIIVSAIVDAITDVRETDIASDNEMAEAGKQIEKDEGPAVSEKQEEKIKSVEEANVEQKSEQVAKIDKKIDVTDKELIEDSKKSEKSTAEKKTTKKTIAKTKQTDTQPVKKVATKAKKIVKTTTTKKLLKNQRKNDN